MESGICLSSGVLPLCSPETALPRHTVPLGVLAGCLMMIRLGGRKVWSREPETFEGFGLTLEPLQGPTKLSFRQGGSVACSLPADGREQF